MKQFLEDVTRDIRHAWRLLRRARGFTVTAIAVLAISIGANTAVFSVINSLLLRPLPYPDPDRIVQVVITHDPNKTSYTLNTSIPKFNAWTQGVRIFSHLAAYQAADPGVNLTDGGPPEHLSALHVSQEYFGVFGARALHGRVFRPQEDGPQGPPVVVLGHGFWVRRFGSNPLVVGRVLPLGGTSYEIVGVLSADFRPDPPVDVYLPLTPDPFSLDFADVVRVAGRMHPNITVARAAGQLWHTSPDFRRKFPHAMGGWEDFWAVPLRDAMVGDVKPALRMLSGAVTFVLLIGCANVATLLLARGRRRGRETATRAALGAQRSRVVRQLLTESGLLALCGGVLGLAAGVAGLRAIVGSYGLMSYSVQQRTQEIGIRMALGAVPADVRAMILFEGLRLAATGVALGTGAALALTRVMVSLVFGVKTYDPAVFIGLAALLSAIALIATLVPAHRATRINPLDAVRGI